MRIPLICSAIVMSLGLWGQNAESKLEFVPNGGQHPAQVLYDASLPGGNVFLEKDRLTFTFCDVKQLAAFHDLYHHNNNDDWVTATIDNHAYQVIFRHANTGAQLVPSERKPHYYNFFRGNDPSEWATDLHPFSRVTYENLYPGISATFYSEGINLKYDLVVAAGAKPELVSLEYTGLDSLYLENGRLRLITSVNDLTELEPFAYQILDGKPVEVPCRYLLRGNVLSFYFPRGYDALYALVIDPKLVAASYSGATRTVEGFVAGFDASSNIISAGVDYFNAYPVTPGAFQTVNQGGHDGAITKLTPDGSTLMWATFLGGDQRENIHSIIANSNNDLVIFGSTAQPIAIPFPTTPGAYDQTYNGNTLDLFLTILNAAGNGLVASTLIGGSGIDGNNDIQYNPEDKLKGEVFLDAADNCYVSVCTKSSDFPVTPGAFQTVFGGVQDGVVFKMNSTLSTLVWSSFIGGGQKDMAYYLRLNAANEVYLVGSTESNNFPTTGGTAGPNYLGGMDGYVAKISSDGSTLQRVTFVGTAGSHDQTNYIAFDAAGDVFIYGHSDGTMPVIGSPIYANPNSGLYVQKLDPNLSAVQVATVIGSGSGVPDLVPTGFAIDECDFIYIGGFERQGIAQHIPTTSDAEQLQSKGLAPNGTNFYFMVFDNDLSDSLYATYMGSASGDQTPGDHTHGGTSRWEPDGSVYQGVCNYQNFPTTSSAYAPNKLNGNIFESDMVFFKFDFEQTELNAEFDPSPNDSGCAPFTVDFTVNDNHAETTDWDFGDGSTSTDVAPTHTFNTPGTYTVQLIVNSSLTCFGADTAELTITVFPQPTADFTFSPPSPVTALTPIQFTDMSTNNDRWHWDFGNDDTSSAQNPLYAYPADGTYNVCLRAIDAGGCEDSICKTIVVNTEAEMVIPTAFTPNNDLTNDIYYVIGYGFKEFEFNVYNRWGTQVFTTSDINQGWDGTWNNTPQPMGVYAYYARGVKFNDEEVILKGNVTLIR